MIGKVISHYRILAQLGEGGMGVVYRAEDTKLQRQVALKFISSRVHSNPEARVRFIHEARAAAAISHANICTIYEIDEYEGQTFIAMEHIEGRSLSEQIADGPLSLADAIGLTVQIAEALHAAHTRGIVHRDIKPANIMVTGEGQAKVLDFGLARSADQTRLTKAGTTLGTVAYMSPEQARGEETDHRADLWSLGVVLYEMLTGNPPFRGDHEQAVLRAILNDTPAGVTSLRSGIPLELERILTKALERDRDHRYQHADDLLADLRKLQADLTEPGAFRRNATMARTAPVSGRQAPRRAPLPRLLIPLAVLLILAVAFLFLHPLIFDEIAISEPTPIAVISFTNQTGDVAFDYLQEAIPNLLITSLEQSPALRVATWERMQDVLKQMGRASVRVIDRDLGFELCRREGIRTIVLGSYVKAGDIFATDVKVLDVDTKVLLKSASSRGQGVGSILEKQIDQLSREISHAAGLSDRRIQAAQTHIVDVTTASMEAYDYFLKGRRAIQQIYLTDTKRYLEKAVSIDSTFAVAHLYLALAYAGLYDTRAETQAYERAMQFSNRASERERLYIAAHFAGRIEKDRAKQLRVLEELTDKYPQDKRGHLFLGRSLDGMNRLPEAAAAFKRALELDPGYGAALNQLAYTYADMDSVEKAIGYLERYAAVAPEDANAYDSMGDLYYLLGRLDESTAAYREALDLKPDFRSSVLKLAGLAALREDYGEMDRLIERFATLTPGAGMVAEGTWWRAYFRFILGDYRNSLTQLEEAQRLATSVNFALGENVTHWLRSWVYYGLEAFEQSQHANEEWNESSIRHFPSSVAYQILYVFRRGLIELQQGRPDSTRQRLAEMEGLMAGVDAGRWRELVEFHHRLLEAELLLSQDSLETVLTLAAELRPPKVETRTTLIDMFSHPWFPLDVLARAHAKAGHLDRAIAEYERMTASDPNQRGRRLVHPLYHYRLARLYEERGSQRAARREYEVFLDIWKNADESRSEVADARTRLAAFR